MTKSVRCADTGLPCRARVTGESDEEVLDKIVAHARDEHGVDLTQAQTLTRYARTLVRDDESPSERES